MRIVCLVENTLGNTLCRSEHGLSIYIESNQHFYLVDVGASDLFLYNAKILDVDLTKVETLFLSHGHYDHGGGILDFHKINPMAKIVMQKSALGDYWHKSSSVEKYIGLNPKIKELANVVLVKQDGDFDSDNIQIFTLKNKKQEEFKLWPEGNKALKEKQENAFVQDSFSHEQYIVLKENQKNILISGCAHNGILNILEEYHQRYKENPDIIISGFHMRKKEGYTETDFDVIRDTAWELKKTGILCYTGHCTGEEPFRVMKEIMGDKLKYLHCGDVIDIATSKEE